MEAPEVDARLRCHRRGGRRAAVVAALLLSLMAAPCGFHERGWPATPVWPGPVEEPVLLPPEFEGRIDHVVLQASADSLEDVTPTFRDLLAQFPPQVRVTILCSDDQTATALRRDLGEAAGARPGRLTLAAVHRQITVWARDRCLAGRSVLARGRVVLLAPLVPDGVEIERHNEVEAVPTALAHLCPDHYVAQAVPLYLEGGNILASRRHVFVGRNLVEANLGPTAPTLRDVRAALQRLFGRPVIVVGETFPDDLPSEHIDMFMTIVDDRTVIVGRRVEVPPADVPDTPRPRLVAHRTPRPGHDDPAGDAAPPPDSCDLVARELRQRGFRVLRVPIHPDRGGSNFVTFNNALLEERDGRRLAYVPAYGLAALEGEARDLYASLGFEVRFIDVRRIHDLEGAVRCLVNVVERGPQAPTPGAAVSLPTGYCRLPPGGAASRTAFALSPPSAVGRWMMAPGRL